jgi:hypothetical protein
MPSNYYLGTSPEESLGDSPRYFYGLRRNSDGELFFVRSDQLKDLDDVELNVPGSIGETFEDFEAGIDFLDGIDADHAIVYDNLKYPQYKWDNRSIFYYIDSQGQLVMRINRSYSYPTGISSNG